jgi:hypothetical protein
MVVPIPACVAGSTSRAMIELRRSEKSTAELSGLTGLDETRAQNALSEEGQAHAKTAATIEVATSAISAVETGVKSAGDTRQAMADIKAKGDISGDITVGKLDDLKGLKLTERTRLADRFPASGDPERPGQFELLTAGKPFSKTDAVEAGFTPKEAEELEQLGSKEGLTADKAADFVLAHRERPIDLAIRSDDGQRARIRGEITKQVLATPGRVLGGTQQVAERYARSMGDIAGRGVGLRDQLYGNSAATAATVRQLAKVSGGGGAT